MDFHINIPKVIDSDDQQKIEFPKNDRMSYIILRQNPTKVFRKNIIPSAEEGQSQ